MDTRDRIRAEEHLKLLGAAHWLFAGGAGCYAFFALACVLAVLTGVLTNLAPTEGFESLLLVVFSVWFVGGLVVSGLNLLAGFRMRAFRSPGLCHGVAILNCFALPPLSTAFGIFTWVVLSRKHIVEAFATHEQRRLANPGSGSGSPPPP